MNVDSPNFMSQNVGHDNSEHKKVPITMGENHKLERRYKKAVAKDSLMRECLMFCVNLKYKRRSGK